MLTDNEKEKTRVTYQKLEAEQSATAVILASFISASCSIIIFYWLALVGVVPVIALVLPGAFIGLMVKVVGNCFKVGIRITPAVSAFIATIIGVYLFQLNPVVYLAALANAAVALMLSKRALSKGEHEAIYRIEKGLVRL